MTHMLKYMGYIIQGNWFVTVYVLLLLIFVFSLITVSSRDQFGLNVPWIMVGAGLLCEMAMMAL